MTSSVFEVIDMRSFSSLWFWILVAVAWSSVSHWILGVPYDVILRARRQGGEALSDLDDLTRLNVNRILTIEREAGLWLAGIVMFFLTVLMVLAAWYQIEFAQAVSFLAVPMSVVGAMSIAAARHLAQVQPVGVDLVRLLVRHRFRTQIVGMISVFVTAMYGMYHNLWIIEGF